MPFPRLSTFLGKITRNLALNKYKGYNAKKRGEGQTDLILSELEACISTSDHVEGIIDELAVVEAINSFLSGLTKMNRAIFVRRYWYMDSVKDIADRGPNGSGKSTITSLLKPPYDYINADEIKAILKCSDLEAAERADERKRMHLQKREDFAFETVLSTERNLNLLRDAKQSGYFIKCYYILTANPLINAARVKLRVLGGGHDVPGEFAFVVDQILGFALLIKFSLCDKLHVFFCLFARELLTCYF